MPMYEGRTNSKTAAQLVQEEREREEYRRHMMGAWGGPIFPATHEMLKTITQTPVPFEQPKEIIPTVRFKSFGFTSPIEDYIDRIIQNGDATIVVWTDKTKTVVKKAADEDYNLYAAVAQALMKKLMGSTSHAHKVIRKKVVVQKPKEPKVKKKETQLKIGVQCFAVQGTINPDVARAIEEVKQYEGEANEAND